MKVLSINVSPVREVTIAGRPVMTGIYKQPVAGKILVGELGLAGDAQADLQNHGGIYKAVYAYPFEHYEHWSRELSRTDFVYGQFGENLTVEGMSEEEIKIGDVVRIGDVLLEVTQPRVPCFKLGHKMGLPQFVKMFAESGRTGFYLRLLEGGEMQAGDRIERIKTDADGMSVHRLMRLMHFERDDLARLQRAIGIPALTPSWREELQERLAELQSR